MFIIALPKAHHQTPFVPNLMSLFHCLCRNKEPLQARGGFNSEELLEHRPTPKFKDLTFSAVRDCLFNVFVATHHIEGRSSIRNLRARPGEVTGTHL
jgi:hypothetical protein